MSLTFNTDKKILMGFSAKAGSVTAMHMFFDYIGVLNEALQYHHWVHEYFFKIYEPQNTIEEPWREDYSSMFKFKVVRNPYTRAVSSYIALMTWKHVIPKTFNLKPDASFNEFLDGLAEADIQNEEIHIRSQKQFYECDKHLSFDYIVRLESLKSDIDVINNDFNIPLKIDDKTKHAHHRHERVDLSKACQDIKASELGLNTSNSWPVVPEYRLFYNQETAEKVYRVYEADFLEYGYDKGRYPR